MNDYLIRIIAKEEGIRGLACVTTNLVNEARERHDCTPTATAVLARALTGGALMGALLKVNQRVALKFEGNGPIQKTVVESDSYGRIRGYVAVPDNDLPQVDGEYDIVSSIGRAGLLTVVKDVRLKDLIEGVVPLASSTIDADLTAYLEQSEQIPSEVVIAAVVEENSHVAVAGGLLLQALPPYKDDLIKRMRDRLQEMPPLQDMLKSGESPEEILAHLFAGIDYMVLEQRPLQFRCLCSRERSRQALLMLGADELAEILTNEGQASITCNFCHQEYLFEGQELETLIAITRDDSEE